MNTPRESLRKMVPNSDGTPAHAEPMDTPWKRVKNPTPIPADLTPQTLAALGDDEFYELIRSQMLPHDTSAAGRDRWRLLWAHLATSKLYGRSVEVLEGFVTCTVAALEQPELEPQEEARARKFLGKCEEAWGRLHPSRDSGPLAWAPRASSWPFDARRDTAILVSAIAAHRAAMTREGELPTDADEELWAALSKAGLDPDDYSDRAERHRS